MTSTRTEWTRRAHGLDLVAAAVAVLVVAVWIAAAVLGRQERANAIAAVEHSGANLARAFEEHALRTLRAVDQSLAAIADEFNQRGSRFDLPSYYEVLRLDPGLYVNGVIFNARGDAIASSERSAEAINIADREHFRAHIARDNGVKVSVPVIGRLSGRQSIIMSRRINRPDGSFGGVVAIAVDPTYFSNFYSQVDVGARGIVALIGRDGIVRARAIAGRSDAGQDVSGAPLFEHLRAAPSGSYSATALTDGVQRIYSYRALRGHPLVVVVAVAKQEALAVADARARDLLVAAAIVSMVLAAGAGLLVALRQRERRHIERLRILTELASDWVWEQDDAYRFVRASRPTRPGLALPIDEERGLARWDLPADQGLANPWAAHRAVLERREPFRDFEFRCRDRGGRMAWISVSGDPIFGASGRFLGYLGVARNITERKLQELELVRAKARLDLALQESKSVLGEMDLATGRLALYRSGGSDRPGAFVEVGPDDALQSVHPEDQPRLHGMGEALVSGRESESLVEYRVRDESGGWSWRQLRARVTEREPKTGRPLRINGISTDISEVRHAAELRIAYARRQRDALVGEVSHRIKNHLQGVAGLLEQRRADADAGGAIDAALRQVEAIASVHGLGSRGRNRIEVARLLEEIVRASEGVAGSRLRLRVAEAARGFVLAGTEAVPVALIMNELVWNAVKHGAAAGPVEVELRMDSDRGLLITVCNPGTLADATRPAPKRSRGLDQLRYLMPEDGASFDIREDGGLVIAEFRLRSPALLELHGEETNESDFAVM